MLAVPVLFGVSLLVFIAVRLAPGDPAQILAGFDANKEMLDAIRREHGLDRPWPEQYLRFMGDLAHLNLGTSTTSRQPVAMELAERLPITAALAVSATIFASIVGM